MHSTNKLENATFATIIFWGMGVSGLFFTQDVIADLREHINDGRGYQLGDLSHLVFEIIAVTALGFGMLLLSIYITDLKTKNARQRETLHSLRNDFDSHVHAQFDDWSLTPSESDIALLLMRGLASKDIAELRNCTVGTIKVHSHNIFRKANVSSRVELMSLFLDEFMDVGMQSAPPRAT
ncbi:helix-turn-helix transcriptional regulator [Celeribacter marinus]|uniref:Transcriptional regulator, LuxR family n=1 Tax=Celeribacter marinus TaxID=1397108 RepID=A0A0N9ZLL5_9RHOB|nr:LuxR C-terminal-related transcriptional regulator [Celeribacter marinus]ALI56584.1 transcriptional regulator, LuxR family [Celeribacter marinus]SFK59567.1 transcriptional regulator, LuxR family [Celeribacter marinus]